MRLFGSIIGITSFLHAAVEQEQTLCLIVAKSEFIYDHARAAIHQLGIRELHVDHLIAFYSAELDHRDGADHVADELLGRTGFQSGATRNELRSYHRLDSNIGFVRNGRIGVHGYAGRKDTVGAGIT